MCIRDRTHTDPKAEFCSFAIVELAALLCSKDTAPSLLEVFEVIFLENSSDEFCELLAAVRWSLERGETLSELLCAIAGEPEKGVSGYCFQTLAAVLYCGIRHHWEAEKALGEIWAAGGDTDSSGAILGALGGALRGVDSFPMQWVRGIAEWPIGIQSFEKLAQATVAHRPLKVRFAWHPLLLLRNFVFFLVVLFHGFTRLVR